MEVEYFRSQLASLLHLVARKQWGLEPDWNQLVITHFLHIANLAHKLFSVFFYCELQHFICP